MTEAVITGLFFVGLLVFLSIGLVGSLFVTPKPPEPREPPSRGKWAWVETRNGDDR